MMEFTVEQFEASIKGHRVNTLEEFDLLLLKLNLYLKKETTQLNLLHLNQLSITMR